MEHTNSSSSDPWDIIGFVDDDAKGTVNGYEVWGTTEDLIMIDEPMSAVLALGNPVLKKQTYNRLKHNTNIQFPNLIHPTVESSRFNIIGHGNVISKGVSMSTNIVLANFNLIHYNCSIGHDVSLGSYNSVFTLTSLSGYVSLKDGVEVGANATVLPSIEVKDNVRIGAGSVVTKDIQENVTVAGVPAKRLK